MLRTLYHSILQSVDLKRNNFFKNIFLSLEEKIEKYSLYIKTVKGNLIMKIRKKFLLLTLAIFILSIAILPVYATDRSITPYFNNTSITDTGFYIDQNGMAWVSAIYNGYTGITTGATITIKLEKKFLWWWNDVDNGWPDNTYVAEFTDVDNFVNYSLQLSKSGTYRATVVYTVYGTAGEPDVITDLLEYEY